MLCFIGWLQNKSGLGLHDSSFTASLKTLHYGKFKTLVKDLPNFFFFFKLLAWWPGESQDSCQKTLCYTLHLMLAAFKQLHKIRPSIFCCVPYSIKNQLWPIDDKGDFRSCSHGASFFCKIDLYLPMWMALANVANHIDCWPCTLNTEIFALWVMKVFKFFAILGTRCCCLQCVEADRWNSSHPPVNRIS